MNPFADYPVIVEQPVVWGELDPHGHVNNIWYFRYIENARVAFYERIGKYAYEDQTGVTFVVGSTSCQFKVPLGFGDTVVTGTRIQVLAEDHLVMAYRLVRKADMAVVAEAEARLVCYDSRNNRKVPIPEPLRRKIEPLLAQPE